MLQIEGRRIMLLNKGPTYLSDNGDSGGIVYVPYGSGYILAGINVAGGIFYNYACKAQYIISTLGVSIY